VPFGDTFSIAAGLSRKLISTKSTCTLAHHNAMRARIA
jgi:hypothetical protein